MEVRSDIGRFFFAATAANVERCMVSADHRNLREVFVKGTQQGRFSRPDRHVMLEGCSVFLSFLHFCMRWLRRNHHIGCNKQQFRVSACFGRGFSRLFLILRTCCHAYGSPQQTCLSHHNHKPLQNPIAVGALSIDWFNLCVK